MKHNLTAAIIIVIIVGLIGIIFVMIHYSNNYIEFISSAKTYKVLIPKVLIPNPEEADINDSCTMFTNQQLVTTDKSANDTKTSQKYIYIEICYTDNVLASPPKGTISTPEDIFTIQSSSSYLINNYKGYKLQIASIYNSIGKLMVILVNPYGGYATITVDKNGQAEFNSIVNSFRFIQPTKVQFTTRDETVIRKIFSDQYQKDITATIGYPSTDANSVGGQVYLPQGQRCFNAIRNLNSWKITYIGNSYNDPKCFDFPPAEK